MLRNNSTVLQHLTHRLIPDSTLKDGIYWVTKEVASSILLIQRTGENTRNF